MRRVMCMYLPAWPLQRLRHARPDLQDKPVAIIRGKEKQEVILCSREASQSRVRPGMPLAEALAIEPGLVIQDEDPQSDLQELERLAGWAERFSPLVGLEEGPAPESLLLDITGCASCFHGEDRLIERAVRELHDQGYTTRAAIADTVGAVWAIARLIQNFHIVPRGETEKTLLPLSTCLLRLPEETVHLLAELGIDQIGQLAALPRPDVAVRFGAQVLRRLDQALGRLAEPIVFCHSLPEIRASWSFEYPTARRDVLNQVVDRLLEEIATALHARNRGTRHLECRMDSETIDIRLVRPSRSAHYLSDLLRTHLEQVRFAGPVRDICLRVPAVEILSEQQTDLYGSENIHEASELQVLLDRLASRLGREAVTLPRLVSDPQPEFACKFEPILSAERKKKSQVPRSALRAPRFPLHSPLQMSPPTPLKVRAVIPEGPPYKIKWAGREYDVLHSWGPQRIETGWWRGKDVHRDYYIVETDQGSRLWVFRRHEDGQWFLHGSFE